MYGRAENAATDAGESTELEPDPRQRFLLISSLPQRLRTSPNVAAANRCLRPLNLTQRVMLINLQLTFSYVLPRHSTEVVMVVIVVSDVGIHGYQFHDFRHGGNK
mmetsp:Transcript_18726/g.37754  ORF Transcript_18726/g.37754 Transcript_18726/m.37754 type:complete len:105 (+) Transcript_18726:645-959(+)